MEKRIPNPKRGEVLLELSGEPYLVRYPFSAMQELKAEFGKSVMKKFQEQGEDVDLADLATVIGVGLRHGGNPIEAKALLDLLDMAHVQDYTKVLAAALGSKVEETDSTEDPTTGTNS